MFIQQQATETSSSQQSMPQEILKSKRENFSVQIRKQERETIFQLKRKQFESSSKEELPFFYNHPYSDSILQAYQEANQQPINQQFCHTPAQSLESYIYHIQILSRYLDQDDCDQFYDTTTDVNIIFTTLRKTQGLPLIHVDIIITNHQKTQQQSAFNILRAFTIPNHSTLQPILPHLHILIEYYLTTPFSLLQLSLLIIFRNLAADCYVCRDTLLQQTLPSLIKPTINSTEMQQEYWHILYNICSVKPQMTEKHLFDLAPILHSEINQNANAIIQFHEPIYFAFLQTLRKIYKIDRPRINQSIIHIMSQTLSQAKCLLNSFFRHPDISNNSQQEILLIFGECALISKEQFPTQLNQAILQSIINLIVANSEFFQHMLIASVANISIAKLMQKCFVVLENFALDGHDNCEFIMKHSSLFDLIITTKWCMHPYYPKAQTFGFLNILFGNCQPEFFIKIVETNQFHLFRQLVNCLEKKENDTVLNGLNTLSVIFARYLSFQQIDKIREVFQEEDGEQMIYLCQQSENDDIYKSATIIYDTLGIKD